MQDCYAGDIGDYGKFGLLRAFEATGMRVGINWYKTNTPASNPHQIDGRYRIKDDFRECDPNLAGILIQIFNSEPSRTIEALEQANLLNSNLYYSESVPVKDRTIWHEKALAVLSSADIVFLDPDNGLIPKSLQRGSL